MKEMLSKCKKRVYGWTKKHDETIFWTINVLAATAWTVLVIDMPIYMICLMCRPLIRFVYETENWHINCWVLIIMVLATWVLVTKKLFKVLMKSGSVLLTESSSEVLVQIVKAYNKVLKATGTHIKRYQELWIYQLAMSSKIKTPLKIFVTELEKGVELK